MIEQFECLVTDILESAVIVKMICTTSSRPVEYAELPLNVVPVPEVGAVFDWLIYDGRSEMVAKELPKLDIAAAEKEGRELFCKFTRDGLP